MNQEVPEHGETPKKTSDKFMTSEDVTLLHSPKVPIILLLLYCTEFLAGELREEFFEDEDNQTIFYY
jgi:hypothetical protein